jgi:hypothetical protein
VSIASELRVTAEIAPQAQTVTKLLPGARDLLRKAAKHISDLEGELLNYADEVAALGHLSPAKIDGLRRIAARIRRDRIET